MYVLGPINIDGSEVCVNIKSTHEPVLDPAGGVMSDSITQEPLWLPPPSTPHTHSGVVYWTRRNFVL